MSFRAFASTSRTYILWFQDQLSSVVGNILQPQHLYAIFFPPYHFFFLEHRLIIATHRVRGGGGLQHLKIKINIEMVYQ